MSATIHITARGQYVVITEGIAEIICNNLRKAIAYCINRGYKFAFGWEE